MHVLALGCNLFLVVSAGVALLSFSRACTAYVKRPSPTTFAPTASPAPNSATAPALKSTEKEEEEEEEEIECGNCQHTIRSEPTQQIMGSGAVLPSEIYTCENCGMQVQVPV